MTLYTAVLSLHVIAAVLGAGQLAALAVLTRSVEGVMLSRLLRNARVALAVLLSTGVGLDFRAGGIWHTQWWFRGSGLLLLATALLSHFTQRALVAQRIDTAARGAWTMCVTVAIMTMLMEWKPL